MAVSIIIADDFPALREGARSWLANHPDLQVIGQAEDGLASVRLVSRHKPDVLVTDLHMPGLSGLEVLQSIRQPSPNTRVVIWAAQFEEHLLLEALHKGALAYILKTSSSENFIRAIRSTARGVHYIDAAVATAPLEVYLKRAQEKPANPLDELTPREREVLHHVAQGCSSAEVARHLHISPRTVEQHRARMMKKLHLRNQMDLMRFALRRGLISWDE